MKKIIYFVCIMSILFSFMFVTDVCADELGYVRQTDIVVFIDYSPVESFNYRDKTYIIAEELVNYGFDVVWDKDKRELRIDREKYNFTPYISDTVNEKKVQPTFEPVFKVYDTDIKTYVNGELAESYNIYGRTVVNIDFLYHWGNCIYDDAQRKYEVRILEKEIEGMEERIETVDESTDYYKYIKTVSEKGVYKDGKLIYGIKKNITNDKYGNNVDIYIGDFVNNKTILYSKSYKYMNAMVNYNLSSPAKVTVKGDNVTPGYTYNINHRTVVKTVCDDSFRYGLMINRISPPSGEEGSEAMYLRADGELYALRYGAQEPDGFNGELFKDGKSVYKGKIYYDLFSFQFHNYGHFQQKNFQVLYAPGYTDKNGVIYYKDESVDGAGSIYYKGNVVNGVAHGNGTMFEYGSRNYDIYTNTPYLIYKDNGQIEEISSAGENVMYVGGFFNGLLNGKGTMYNVTGGGISCVGEWENGVLNGNATLYCHIGDNASGLLYEGEMKNNLRDGLGIEYSAKGNPFYEGFYKRFVGQFKDGNWHNGKWYEIEYNAQENLHDIYLYYEGEFRYGEKQYGTHYRYYNEQNGQYETRTGYFDNWKYIE